MSASFRMILTNVCPVFEFDNKIAVERCTCLLFWIRLNRSSKCSTHSWTFSCDLWCKASYYCVVRKKQGMMNDTALTGLADCSACSEVCASQFAFVVVCFCSKIAWESCYMKFYVKNFLKHWYTFFFSFDGFIFHIHNSVQIWVSVPQTWKHLKYANQILDWPVTTQVTRDIWSSVLIWMAGLILSVKLWHLVDVSVRPAGFFGIVRISPAEIYQVNKLLAFILPVQCVISFLFIHHMIFSLVGHTTYCGMTVQS